MKLIIGLLLPLLIIVSFSSALHSEEYLRSLTNKISQECGSNDYSIKEGILFNRLTRENITLVKNSEANYEALYKIISYLDQLPYVAYTPMPCENAVTSSGKSNAIMGCGLLRCGDHKLDVSGDTFYWDNVKFEEIKREFNYAEANGEGGQACSGAGCQNTQFNFKLAFGITLSIAIIELGVIISQFIRNKKLKQANKHKRSSK